MSSLLEKLTIQLPKEIRTRRYSLAEIISESYRSFYNCRQGSTLQKLAESHLDDVRSNPTDIDRLSYNLCLLKELDDLIDAGKINESSLISSTHSVIHKSLRESTDTTYDYKNKSTSRDSAIDDTELTDEEVDELAKHLSEIRKNKKMEECDSTEKSVEESAKSRKLKKRSSTENSVEEAASYDKLVSRISIKQAKASLVALLNKMTEEGISDIYSEDSSSEMNNYICLDGAFLDLDNLIQYTGAMDEAKSEKRFTIIKHRQGKKDIETTDTLEELLKKFSYTLEKGSSYEHEKGNKKINKKPTTIKSLITNLNNAENNAAANGYSGTSYDYKEAETISESKSWASIDLSEFNKKSATKAFMKTFKKLDGKLHEGKALTRQESISLYKAANSAMTHLSVELEHNPEFLATFNESVSLLSSDVDKLLESMKKDKAPSKATMKSLAKFSEAILREDDEEDEIPAIEDEDMIDDEEFTGDEEGDISDEEEQFDQEYADARVELHKELAAEHAEDESPEVQDKLQQDASEVVSLPGITDDQVAEIEGAAPEEEESTEEVPDGDESPEEEEVEESEDDDITADELEELKKHLSEMREAKKKLIERGGKDRNLERRNK